MQKKALFNFDSSYLSLPETFYSLVKPSLFTKPETFLFNEELSKELDLTIKNQEELIQGIFSETARNEITSFAQAYAGHQFGNFTRLGDGRAIVLGEHLTECNQRFDIQLKGSGRTIYSRNGDGKASFKAMLREYLISEAMHHLQIPSSRSLAVIKTGDEIYRDERMQESAVLIRVMKSHIRVGTFEFAAAFGSKEDLQTFANYTINRLYPEIATDENPTLSFLYKVMDQQIDLVANWMRVGFIHGVMNTDNTSISGETFDYGPCAFMNTFHPDTVYSSIDTQGRYSFGNQAKIIKWNIARFAEALLPIIHENIEEAIKLAQTAIDSFDEKWERNYYGKMLNKIGFETNEPKLYVLVDELLDLMRTLELDFTNTFLDLTLDSIPSDNPMNNAEFLHWHSKWKELIEKRGGMKQAQLLMRKNNPFFIPRNHLVEQALYETENGNNELLEKLLNVLSKPYEYQEGLEDFRKPSSSDFEERYQTFCGT
jgi:serine/tyrosine/threonine adenylyltransferase